MTDTMQTEVRIPARDRVLILDFGSQFTQLIARRVRESGVYCEILPATAGPDRILDFGASAFILSGGPASVMDAEAPRVPDVVFQSGLPVLGICYGQQAMCAQLGGEVALGDHQEFGHATLTVTDDCTLFHGAWELGGREQVWMSHGDHVTRLPPGFRAVASSAGAPFAAIADDVRRYYGSTRRSCIRRMAASCCITSPTAWRGWWATGRWPGSATRRRRASGRRSGRAG
jgi:GMP synthase (glutamine-hydrolysing)